MEGQMAAQKFVDIEALNLRSKPEVDPANRLAILHIGQPIQEDRPAEENPEWIKVKVDVDGTQTEGFVKKEINGVTTLRSPVSAGREALVAQAIKEWLRFERGEGQETHDPYYKFVGEMWQAIGVNLDGRDDDVPWSAAAISYMVRHAGATVPKYLKFKFASAHSVYFHDSIKKAQANDPDAPFFGVRHFTAHPQIGDIAGKTRGTVPHTFDDAAAGESFKSHSDIIVSVQADYVLAIGGNVRNSVSITKYQKTPSGFLTKDDGVIILMVNQT
jgi:hypothetical protein